MKVQSIGQNNYNCANRQNANNQPAFKKNIICNIIFADGKVPSQLPKELREAFRRLMIKAGIIDESNIVLNKVDYWHAGQTDRGFLAILDRTSPFTKERFPEDVEKQYLQDRVIRKAYRRKEMLKKMPADLAERMGIASRSFYKTVNDSMHNDPNLVRCTVEERDLRGIAIRPHNIPNSSGDFFLAVPLHIVY